MPAIAVSTIAASATVRAIGPTVSWLDEIGITPARLTRPTVGFIPTSAHMLAGDVIEPSVSLPSDAAHRLAAVAAAEPLLDPDADRSSAYGLRHWPPRALHPETDCTPRRFAHSERFALPRMIAPAARSFAITNASRGAGASARASEPAVVSIESPVSMLSFTRIGMPCNGPRNLPAARSASSVCGDRLGLAIDLEHRVQRLVQRGDPRGVRAHERDRGRLHRSASRCSSSAMSTSTSSSLGKPVMPTPDGRRLRQWPRRPRGRRWLFRGSSIDTRSARARRRLSRNSDRRSSSIAGAYDYFFAALWLSAACSFTQVLERIVASRSRSRPSCASWRTSST